jgi:hypothetical protein
VALLAALGLLAAGAVSAVTVRRPAPTAAAPVVRRSTPVVAAPSPPPPVVAESPIRAEKAPAATRARPSASRRPHRRVAQATGATETKAAAPPAGRKIWDPDSIYLP